MKTLIRIFAAVMILSFISCDTDSNDLPVRNLSGAAEIGDRIQAFGLDLFRETHYQSTKDNICVSPLSVSTAVSMALNGAEGQTKEDIHSTLYFHDFTIDSINAGFQLLNQKLEPDDQFVTFHSVNAAFWDESRVLPYSDFLDGLTDGFNAKTQKLDFNQVQSSVDQMNNWVETNTEDKIKDLIKTIKDRDAMFLINALYFKGNWENPFEEQLTVDGDFYKPDGSTVIVPFMNHDFEFNHFIGADYSAVDMAFGQSGYSMSLILPANQVPIDQLVDELDPELIKDLYEHKLQPGRLMLMMPKFEIEFELNLKDVLSVLGMQIAFDMALADFTKLGDAYGRNLYIDRVQHKTKLLVDEKGVEGAAATAVVIGIDSLPPSINLNRPFIYMIRHMDTNTILFIGKVGNPKI